MAKSATVFLGVLLFSALSITTFAYETKSTCSTKKLAWVQSGHNEDCTAVCKRKSSRKPFSTGGSLLCADNDPMDFNDPLQTDWVTGSFVDLQKDPNSPQKECYIHRKYFDDPTDPTLTEQPIAESSNFYCGCWKDTTACKKWKPKWITHGAANGQTAEMATCDDVCKGAGLIVVDRTPLSYNYICRPTGLKSAFGWEHYEGDAAMNMCHYVQYDAVKEDSYNAKNGAYECLCQKN